MIKTLIASDSRPSGDCATQMGLTFRFPLALVVAMVVVSWSPTATAQVFDEAVVNIGNTGLTITNAGFVGNANIRNNPQGPPSFEYPLNSGTEHLFESGLWVGARRVDGQFTVRTGAIASSAGYRPGAPGFEFIPRFPLQERSTLPERDSFSPAAVSHQDYIGRFDDNTIGASPPIPDSDVLLGMDVEVRTYAWNFPFTEAFVIVEFDIRNTSGQAWDSVYVGMWHDLVVRNVNTTTDAGSAFFNKNGAGFIGYPIYEAGTGRLLNAAPDSLNLTYAWNAGGTEQSLNTYGSIAFLGAEWDDPRSGSRRFFHPELADEYRADGYPAPRVNPRWWQFGGGQDQLARPQNDQERYDRMATPFPNPVFYQSQAAYETARNAFFTRLRTDGVNQQGNWLGMTSIGPVPRVEAGSSLTVTFAFVAALKPQAFQSLAGRPIDNAETRVNLRTNADWAQRTYIGDGVTRYRIPEPPSPPRVKVVPDDRQVTLYWDRTSEFSRDPITGMLDFEGYRIYQSTPGDDRLGDPLGSATLVAQYDSMIVRETVEVVNPDGTVTTEVRSRNQYGFNNGFCDIRIRPEEADGFETIRTPPCEACFSDQVPGNCRDVEATTVEDRLYYTRVDSDTTRYSYRFVADNLLNGWQYAFAVTAFDSGDPDSGLPSFESGRTATAIRAFPGTPAVSAGDPNRPAVGVYPNPYRVRASWTDGGSRTQKLYFTNLPARAEIRVYTLAGDIIAQLSHDAGQAGDIAWYQQYSGPGRVQASGEHGWDLLSESVQQIATGLYFYSVQDIESGDIQTGRFVIIK
ncbi:hypothetical protein BH23BAC4_BH23BAC4_00420 [soil metagenome]